MLVYTIDEGQSINETETYSIYSQGRNCPFNYSILYSFIYINIHKQKFIYIHLPGQKRPKPNSDLHKLTYLKDYK